MRRILAVDDDRHTRPAIGIWLHAPSVPLIAISGHAFSAPGAGDSACFKMALSLGATRCLRKPSRPATLLGVIGEGLSEAGQRRKHAAALAAITSAPPSISREGEYGLNCKGATMPRSQLSSLRRGGRSHRHLRQTKKPGSPATIATEEWLD